MVLEKNEGLNIPRGVAVLSAPTYWRPDVCAP